MSTDPQAAFATNLRAACREEPLPGGDPVAVVAADALAREAADAGLSLRAAEAAACRAGIVPERYLRNLRTFDAAQQARLLESRVAMVGLGGLGGSLLETMARMGVGTIRAADGDTFEPSNLNRQRLSATDRLHLPKADAGRDACRALNPAVEFEGWNRYLAPGDLPEFLAGADLVIDALGGLDLRTELRRAAADTGLPMVSGALAGWTGFAATVLPGNPGPADFMGRGESAENSLGCPAPAVEAVAAVMAAEILRVLAGEPAALAGRMIIMDLARMSFDTIQF